MLEELDGVTLAVRDVDVAAATFEAIFQTSVEGRSHSDVLNADIVSLACGTDVIRLATPTAAGPVSDHLDDYGEGLFAAAFAAKDLGALAQRLEEKDVGTRLEDGVVHLDPWVTHGLRTMLVQHRERDRVGLVSFIYEVTHLVDDWKAANDFWTDIFGLDGAKFAPIKSDTYGYEGMLTLFDPPRLLDRIEVVTPHDRTKAMGRFFEKRGEGPYMFFCECADMEALRQRLRDHQARFAPDDATSDSSLFVHPSSTHGVLIGVSPTDQAWVWSGRPELARRSAD